MADLWSHLPRGGLGGPNRRGRATNERWSERPVWPDFGRTRPRAAVTRRARDATAGLTVTRLADAAGVVSFAGTPYAAGRRWARTAIDVCIVAASVQLSKDGHLIRVHPIRHDRSRELGAFANPKGRPRRKNSATGNVS